MWQIKSHQSDFLVKGKGKVFPYSCRILSRTFPCLSPNIGLQYSILLPFAKTVCVSVRKNSVDVSTDRK